MCFGLVCCRNELVVPMYAADLNTCLELDHIFYLESCGNLRDHTRRGLLALTAGACLGVVGMSPKA